MIRLLVVCSVLLLSPKPVASAPDVVELTAPSAVPGRSVEL